VATECICSIGFESLHSGKYCYGKTPMQPFMDSVFLAREKMLDAKFSSAPEPSGALRSGAQAEARFRLPEL